MHVRLNLLAAFEAVQRVGDEWRLTPIGESALAANPPQELPDFSVMDDTDLEVTPVDGTDPVSYTHLTLPTSDLV